MKEFGESNGGGKSGRGADARVEGILRLFDPILRLGIGTPGSLTSIQYVSYDMSSLLVVNSRRSSLRIWQVFLSLFRSAPAASSHCHLVLASLGIYFEKSEI